MAMLAVFEGRSSGVPRALYQLIEPYRQIVAADDDTTEDDDDTTTPTTTADDVNIFYQIESIAVTVPLAALSGGYVRQLDAPDGTLDGDGSVGGVFTLYVDGTRAGSIALVRVTDVPGFRLALVGDRGGVLLATMSSALEPSATEVNGVWTVTLGDATVIATPADPP